VKVKVECIKTYFDIKQKKQFIPNNEIILDEDRAEHLINLGYVKFIEQVKEEKEDKKLPTKKVEKRK
jgi:hypothetical protein